MNYTLLTAIAVFAGGAHAEEVSRELPKESAWVRYHMTEEWEDGTERTVQFEIHVFAPATIENQNYRWIELKSRSDEIKPWSTVKWQVLEEDIQRGGTALVKARNAWRKTREGKPQRMDLEEAFARLYLFAPPPLKGAKITGEKESIDWQRGKLQCQVATLKRHDKFRTDETDTDYRLFLNPQVPLGIAGAKLSLTDSAGVKGTIEYLLLDMGTNAKSEFPNVN